MSYLEKKIFLICPVREVSTTEKTFLDNYVSELEARGYKVHYPHRDTNQNDATGLNICTANKEAIASADEVHIYWAGSKGSLFDFGMTFMANKPLKLINPEDVHRTERKSFDNVLLELHEKYSSKCS